MHLKYISRKRCFQNGFLIVDQLLKLIYHAIYRIEFFGSFDYFGLSSGG